jgi:electron transport complex protein RnfB
LPHTIIETCIGCTGCIERCPTGAISGVRDRVHVIDPELCIDCGACGMVCPRQSILDETGSRSRWLPRWPRAIVIEDNCIGRGCELCIQICPSDALSLGKNDGLVGDFFGVAVVDERRCTGCRLCEQVCGWDAIYVDLPPVLAPVSLGHHLRRPAARHAQEKAWPQAA